MFVISKMLSTVLWIVCEMREAGRVVKERKVSEGLEFLDQMSGGCDRLEFEQL